jgi:hypothetical protein
VALQALAVHDAADKPGESRTIPYDAAPSGQNLGSMVEEATGQLKDRVAQGHCVGEQVSLLGVKLVHNISASLGTEQQSLNQLD